MNPSVLTCGGALIGVLPWAGDGAKILIRNGDEVIAVTRGGTTLGQFDPFASIRSQIATPEDIARLTNAQVGNLGETVARNMLTQNGYTVLMSVQNASGNGLDVLARAADGSLVALEVKTTGRGTIGSLTSMQANSIDYVQKIIREAVTGELRG